MRWALALAVTLVIVVAGVAVAIVAIGSRTTTALGPSFLPAASVAYVEARLDLPGDQHDHLVDFIGRFPGFDDPANFDLKVNDTLDRFLGSSTEGRITYTRDVKPWFTGEVAIGLISLPEMDQATFGDSSTLPPVVMGLGVSDRAALERFIQVRRTEAEAEGATFTESTHAGATVVSWRDNGSASTTATFAITDDVLLVAMDEGNLRAALDVRARSQPSLADAEPFKQRMAALPAQRLGAVYMDLGFLREAVERSLGTGMAEGTPGASPHQSAGASPNPALGLLALDQLPTHFVAALRVEGGRLLFDTRVAQGPAAPTLAMRATTLAERMPPTTVFYTESRDVGRVLQASIGQLKSQFGDQLPAGQLRQVEEFLGTPVEDFLTWIADVGLAVSVDGERVSFGLAATVTDEGLAIERVARLSAAISAAAVLGDAPFEVDEETVGEARLTTITLPADATAQLPSDLPFEPSLSYTVHGGVFYLGLSDFVRSAVARAPADSLASTEAYRTAVEAAGGLTNTAISYLDVASIREAVERVLPAAERARYDTEIRPYLAPLDRLVAVGTALDGDLAARILLFVE